MFTNKLKNFKYNYMGDKTKHLFLHDHKSEN